MNRYTSRIVSKFTATALASLALLTSCSSSDNSSSLSPRTGLTVGNLAGQSAEQVQSPWLVTVEFLRLQSSSLALGVGAGDTRVRTFQYSTDRTFQEHIDWYQPQVELDTCVIDDIGITSGTLGDPLSVDGGQEVFVNDPSGTAFSIGASSNGAYFGDPLIEPLSTNTTLSIPGNIFPTVDSYPLSEPLAPVRLAPPSNTAVTVESEYLWEPNNDSNTYITLAFIEYDDIGDFLGFPVVCNLVDDGEFELPSDVLSVIANTNNILQAWYIRDERFLDLEDGVVIFRRSSVAE